MELHRTARARYGSGMSCRRRRAESGPKPEQACRAGGLVLVRGVPARAWPARPHWADLSRKYGTITTLDPLKKGRMDFNENSAQSRVVPKAKTLLSSSTREHWPRAKPYSHFSPLLLLKSVSHRDKKKNLGFPISIASPIPTEARDEESKDVHC